MYEIDVVMLLVSMFSIVLGYLISVKQKRQLISGWDESKVENPEAYARLVGGSILFMGILFGLNSIGKSIGLISDVQYVCVLSFAALTPAVSVVVARKKYRKRTVE